MQTWLEKYHSLMQAMLFSGGHLSANVVEDIRASSTDLAPRRSLPMQTTHMTEKTKARMRGAATCGS